MLVMAILAMIPAGMAAAGGWAMASFDETPAPFRAGETRQIGYRILQHGRHPVDVASTEIRLFDASGQVFEFTGEPAGQTGHYRAEVTLPAAGTYRWEVTLGYFPAQELGTIDVIPRLQSAESGDGWEWARTLLPLAAALAGGLVVLQAIALRRPVDVA